MPFKGKDQAIKLLRKAWTHPQAWQPAQLGSLKPYTLTSSEVHRTSRFSLAAPSPLQLSSYRASRDAHGWNWGNPHDLMLLQPLDPMAITWAAFLMIHIWRFQMNHKQDVWIHWQRQQSNASLHLRMCLTCGDGSKTFLASSVPAEWQQHFTFIAERWEQQALGLLSRSHQQAEVADKISLQHAFFKASCQWDLGFGMYHICSLIFFPSSSMVRILKSIL